jgi:hypothetical protein
MVVLWPLGTPSFDKSTLLYECKILWNRIMKGIEIFVLKGFGIIYVKSMVGKWCDILVIHKH